MDTITDMESLLKPYMCAQASEATHLSLVGGKFNIDPPDRFHRIYSKMYVHGAHLVEKVRYPSRWYLDYDKVSRSFVDDSLVPRLREFGHACVVCVCQDTWDGVHVIFSDLIVQDKEDARTWADTFANTSVLADYDVSVYSSGLRMIGSKKKTVDRIYMPYQAMDKLGNDIDIDTTITPQLLRLCSIHPDDTQTVVVVRPERKPLQYPTDNVLPFNMKKMENGWYYWFTKEKYCENIGREHKSANRMYELDPVKKRMRVRCSCKCHDTGCKEYRGQWQSIPINLYPYMENEDVRPRKQSKRVCHAFAKYDIHDIDRFVENLFG